jgi:hypothetical protein
VHHASTQTPLAQTPDAQSDGETQPPRSGHAPQVPPPQSTPVSVPFFTPSSHAGAWHAPPVHTPDWQSAPAWHVSPVAQPGHAPPQSFAVS